MQRQPANDNTPPTLADLAGTPDHLQITDH